VGRASATRPLPLVAVIGGAVLLVPIAAAVVLRPGSGAQASGAHVAAAAPSVSSPARPGFPAPPRGAVVFSRQLGSDALALGVVPGHGKTLVQASVVGPTGAGVSGLSVVFTVQGAARAATSCGPGCYRAAVAAHGRPPAVDVALRGRAVARWHVVLPAAWPPADGSALLARAGAAWRSLRSLSFSESLASGPGRAVLSTWRVQAPDRVAYRVEGGSAGIVVGERRWDRSAAGRRWVPSAQTRLTQPIPNWVRVTDAHVLGSTAVRGRPVWRVSFYDPVTPAWFTVLLDKSTMRTLETRMTATAHFMRDEYGSFNATPAILPPH